MDWGSPLGVADFRGVLPPAVGNEVVALNCAVFVSKIETT